MKTPTTKPTTLGAESAHNGADNRHGGLQPFYAARNAQEDSLTLETALEAFIRALEGRNRGAGTIRAYRTDVAQFIVWIHENNIVARIPPDIERTG